MLLAPEICDQFSDQELVRKSIENVDFFSCVYSRYESRLMRYIKRIAKVTEEEAEDILQEAFIKIWKNLRRVNTDLKLSSWVYRIVHNEVISRWRKNEKLRNRSFLALNDEIVQNITEELIFDAPHEVNIKLAIQKLPEKYREVLILRYFEDMSYDEISDVLKLPAGTVAIRIKRAKKHFATFLKQLEKRHN